MSPASKNLLFGTAGIPLSASRQTTPGGIERIRELGLDCLEIEFVKGIKMGTDLAKQTRELSQQHKVILSVHAPYYINLNSAEEGKRLASQERLLSTARRAEICGARNVVFHPGYYGRLAPEESFENIRKIVGEIVSILKTERSQVILRPETMGKKSQFGSLEEVLLLCRKVDGLLPCLDFSHIHSRDRRANSYRDFYRILKKVETKLGKDSLKRVHIHISGTEYNERGEMKHLNLGESDFCFDDWLQALKDLEVEGMVVCESPNLEKDALMLKRLYCNDI